MVHLCASIFQERIAGPVFMLLTASTFHFVKNCFQGPFAENVTALIKIWCFLKGILPPLAEKMSTRCCLFTGKNVSIPSCLHAKLTDCAKVATCKT